VTGHSLPKKINQVNKKKKEATNPTGGRERERERERLRIKDKLKKKNKIICYKLKFQDG
jgi:hypothetical protein